MKKFNISVISLLFLSSVSYAANTDPKTTDIVNGNSLAHAIKNNSDTEFFTQGYAEVRGKIEDYNPESDPKNFLVYIQDNLIGAMEPISVQIAQDGSFITWLPLTTPGFARFVGGNRYFDFFLKPEHTLEVSFNWKDVSEYCDKKRKEEQVSQSLFHFGEDLSRINQELMEYPEDESYRIYQMAHDLTPSEAIEKMTESYEKQMHKVNQYCEGKNLDPTTQKILKANVKSEYLYNIFVYADTRENIKRRDSLAPSLKEPLDLKYFDNVKKFLADDDKWILATRQFGGIPNRITHSALSNLLNQEEYHLEDFGSNAFRYLKSLGATLTPEEEEINEWLGDGGYKSCTFDEISAIFKFIRNAAERNELSEQYNEYLMQQLTGPRTLLSDAPRNVRNFSKLIKTYLGVDSLPLFWQVALSESLRSKYSLRADFYPDQNALYSVLKELKSDGEISNPAIFESLDNFYRREYSRKSFDIPDDEKGRVIKELIAPYSGKMLLIDFWGIYCGPCVHTIKTTVKAREKNQNHPDFKMLFISDDSAPLSKYEDFVMKYLDGETSYRISESDFHLLRDLFSFSGIPRYVLISKDGKVLDSDFNYFAMKRTLKEYGIELEGDVLDDLREAKNDSL